MPRSLTAWLLALVASTAPAADPPKLELAKGDHVCIVGNTLADRMQHDGWLEAYLVARHPAHDLTVRNLGFSADELTVRLRSMDFGTPDQWLSASAPVPQPRKLTDPSKVPANRFEKVGTKADVIFAFFGYNESWAGEAGLPKFKADLEQFITHTLGQKYNGKSAPRLVLFSPIAFENHNTPNLPDGADTNARLELYTKAMAEVAGKKGVPFVDLFTPTRALFAKSPMRLTINGVHLTPDGNRELAAIIDTALFGKAEPPATAALEKVRRAVLDKNFYWYQRYRATDGYSTFGDRAFLKFAPDQQSNYEVVQRELEALDVLTANRDKVIWAVAKGQDAKPDDSNLPPFVAVKTNKPGPLPGGKHKFLTGEEAVKDITPGKGVKVNLFADEALFPDLANPVQMSWDARGRLWVAVWHTYPHWKPTEPMNDKLLILEDTDGDGKADKCSVFADGLHNPTGFEFVGKGVLIAQAPDLVYLEDTDGDGKADVRKRVLSGLDTADTHHTSNSFVLDPGGAVYFQEGTFHHTQIETPYGPPQRVANGAVFRYEPRSQKVEVYVTHGFANPHGHAFDRWGQDIVVDGTGANPYHATLFNGYLPYPQKHARPPQVYQQRTRPCPGIDYLSSRHFPDDWQGNLIVPNVIGVLGLLRYKIDDNGASFKGAEQQPVLLGTDQNFRPSDLKVGPDGAIYFLDWHNPIIGHMQHNLRDPSRDRTHGRVFRVTYEGRPLTPSPKIAGEPVATLLDLLKHPDDPVRRRVRIELAARDTTEVLAAAKAKASAADDEHTRLELLWLHQSHNVVDMPLLDRVLASPDFRARAAAVRVLVAWRDRASDPLGRLKVLAADPHPRVRLEAVRGASFFPDVAAAEVVAVTAEQPTDEFITHVVRETVLALDPHIQVALRSKAEIRFVTRPGARAVLEHLATEIVQQLPKSASVYAELLGRPGVLDDARREAAAAVASAAMKPPARVLLDAFQGATTDSVRFDLGRLLTDRPAELVPIRPEVQKVAAAGLSATTRQLAFTMLIAADGGADKAWEFARKDAGRLTDFAAAVPVVRDPNLRAALYPTVAGLLAGLPPGLESKGGSPQGRFVRISLPGKKKILSLAEVEVLSSGVNVARQGKTSHSSFQHDGWSSRAIDGNTSGEFSRGGITHTAEGDSDPWWEVDLGAERPVDSVVVYNRTDGKLGGRLNGFTLTVLDAQRKPVFERTAIPAPAVKATIGVGDGGTAWAVRRAAMTALATVRGKETDTVRLLVPFTANDADRASAVSALLRVPVAAWPSDVAPTVLTNLTHYVSRVPESGRTTPDILDALQLADTAAGLLPKEQAKAARRQLGDLGVRVVRVGTLTDQMLFDKDRIVVQAGKPVEFVFENTDIMPHNFVITKMGALEEVGNAGEAFGSSPKAAERGYVPPSDKVLLGSRLLMPRDSQVLRFTAPASPGVYPYVCTYPGHWRRMHGALYVVADLDEYLADPAGYIAKNPVPVSDQLLKENRPRTEWTLAELAPAAAELDRGGRSFAHGKQMFTVGTCIACHKFNGEGQEFGPNLADLDPKVFKTPADVLEHVLEPSKRIEDKYRSYAFALADGGAVTAMVLEKTADSYKVIENPLAKAEPRVIKAADLDGPPKPSMSSIMPKGLLDKLTKDEILDLVAYVWAKGDGKNKVFQGGHDGHKH
ncbi:MAG: PVC-type heme-binding CxxCH protein [Gemmataceae bacterium]